MGHPTAVGGSAEHLQRHGPRDWGWGSGALQAHAPAAAWSHGVRVQGLGLGGLQAHAPAASWSWGSGAGVQVLGFGVGGSGRCKLTRLQRHVVPVQQVRRRQGAVRSRQRGGCAQGPAAVGCQGLPAMPVQASGFGVWGLGFGGLGFGSACHPLGAGHVPACVRAHLARGDKLYSHLGSRLGLCKWLCGHAGCCAQRV